jgi:hypothetical protein
MVLSRRWLLEQLKSRFPKFRSANLPKVVSDLEDLKMLECIEYGDFRKKTASRYRLAGPLAALYISYKRQGETQ